MNAAERSEPVLVGRWSLRRRLALAAGAAAAVVLFGTALLVFVVARGRMIDDFDRTWQARGAAVGAALEYQDDGWDLEERSETMAVFALGPTSALYQIWVGATVVARSPSLSGKDLPGPPPRSSPAPRSAWAMLPDGRAGRVQTWTFVPDHEAAAPSAPSLPEATIVVIAGTAELHRAITDLAWLLGWSTAVGAVVAALLMAGVVAQALRPLAALHEQLAACAPGRMQAVMVPDPPRELVPVMVQLNAAFARLEAALAREQGFTADAAHELRTPLAALRLLLEVSLSEADSPDARRQDTTAALALALRLQRLVEALLALARLDRGLVRARPEPVVVAEVMAEAWATVATAAAARGITCRSVGLSGVSIDTDRDLLRQILVNLCDNAVSHGDAHAEVVITAATAAGLTITIANAATAAPTDLSLAGQRLWRADPARTDAGRHVGIGLSLCRRLAEVIGGALRLERAGSQVIATVQLAKVIRNNPERIPAATSEPCPEPAP